MTPLRPVTSPPSRRAGPQSVGRVFAMLDAIALLREGATLSELARIARAPKTSLVGLLAGLTQEGCLVRDASGRYRLGPRVHALASRTMQGRDLIAQARPALQRLVEDTGETAVIGALAPDADRAVYLDKVESPNPIRYAVTVGDRRELYCTAMGRALLAFLAPERIREYLRSPRDKWTAETLTSAADILAELARVRREGIARTFGERIAGASALAVPVFGRDGAVVAAVLVAGPTERMRLNMRRNEKAVREAAAECSRLAGGRPFAPGRKDAAA